MSSVIETAGVQYSAEAAGLEGNIRCHVVRRQLPHDNRVHYSIVITNESTSDAQAFAFVPISDREWRAIMQTAVGASSELSTSLVQEIIAPEAPAELHMELSSSDTNFTLTVPTRTEDDLEDSSARTALAVRKSGLRRSSGTSGGSGLAVISPFMRAIEPFGVRERIEQIPTPPKILPFVFLSCALLILIGYVVTRPRIVAFAPPNIASAGATIAVPYTTSGIGSADYTVYAADGQTLVHEPVASGRGSFSFRLPSSTSSAYRVQLRLQNPLVAASAEGYITVASPAPQAARNVPPPQIRSLALDRSTVVGGSTLNVYYDVLATRGSVSLVDPSSQVSYGRSDLTGEGHASFVTPHVDAPRYMSVIVSGSRGDTAVRSTIGVTVVPEPTTAPNPPVSRVDEPQGAPLAFVAQDAPDASAPVDPPVSSSTRITVQPRVASGARFRVAILDARSDVRIAMLDATGNELERHNVPVGQTGVVFQAPQVGHTQRVLLQATYAAGQGDETVVRAIWVKR